MRFAGSSDWLILGVMILYCSFPVSQVAGETGRMGSLVCGFILIFLSSVKRIGMRGLLSSLSMIAAIIVYFLFLEFYSRIQEHSEFYLGNLMFVFRVICLFLFVSGLFIGLSTSRETKPPNPNILFLTLVVVFILHSFVLRSVNYSDGSSRSIDGGNPVGLAYNFMIVGFSCFALFLTVENKIVQYISLAIFMICYMLAFSVGSRGAVICSTFLTLMIFIFYTRVNNQQHIAIRLVCICLVVLLCLTFVVPLIPQARVDMSTGRLMDLTGWVSGRKEADQAIRGRIEVYTQISQQPSILSTSSISMGRT